jgi:integration host factor subunit beta
VTKSELIERIAQKQTQLAYRDVELAVKTVLEHMAERLAGGDRIEIRGFGSFSLHYRPGRVGRNPKTGAPVSLPAKHVPHFKPGKELRERVDEAYAREREAAASAVATGPATEALGSAAADPASAD